MLDDFDDLRLRELLLFERVVSLGTIAAAARELGLPKPTAGRWLAALETRVGAALLHRGPRSVVVTDRGRAFHEQALRVLGAARGLRAVAQGERAGGTLRASVPVPFGRLVGGTVIAKFRRAMPGVRLEILLDNRRVDLVRDRVDMAIRGGSLPDSDLVARRLAVVPMWLYTYPGSEGGPTGLIAAPGDESMLAAGRPELLPATVVVDDRLAVRDALIAGAGAGVLPAFLGEDARARGELVRLGERPVATVPVHALWLREAGGDVRVRTLVALISAELAPWAGA